MRNVTFTPSSSRSVSGRVIFRDVRLRFSRSVVTENIVTPYSYDSDISDGVIHRVATVNNRVYYDGLLFSNPGNGVWTNTGIDVYPLSRPGIFANRMFYQDTDGSYKYRDYDNGFGAATQFNAGSANIAVFAPVSATSVYALTMSMGDVNYIYLRQINISTGNVRLWKGLIYETEDVVPIMDAVAGDYIYFTTDNNKRTLGMTRNGDLWSDPFHVVPIDIIDDDSLFTLSGVGNINGYTMITGKMNRKSGLPFFAYTFGPDECMLGRDIFISGEDTSYPGGKLFLDGDTLRFIGFKIRYEAPATYLIGVDNASMKHEVTELGQVSLQYTHGGASALTVGIPASADDSVIVSGAEMNFIATINETEYDFGKFVVDAISDNRDVGATDLQISGRANGTKRLSQWESDAAYDYWSQSKCWCDPSDLGDVARVDGTFDTLSGDFYLKDYNKDGLCYVATNSSPGGLIYSRMKVNSGDHDIKFGVGLCYRLENKNEAADRLDIEVSEVTDEDFGSNGLYAIYGGTEHSGGAGISLNVMVANEFTKITSASVTFMADVWYWIMLKFSEGYANVYYRADEDEEWIEIISRTVSDAENTITPYIGEKRGRGSLYIRNVTPNSECYSFNSDDDFIPLKSITGFPLSDTVIVNSEHIGYDLRGGSGSAVGPFSYSYGTPLAQNTTIGTVQNFAYSRETNYVIQTLSFSGTKFATGVELYMGKVNYPEDGVEVSLWHGPVTVDNPLGTKLCSAVVSSDRISEDGGWVYADFGEKVEVTNADWLVIMRNSNHAHPSPESYYFVTEDISESGLYIFREDTDEWINQNASMAFKLYGSVTDVGGQYAVHLEPDAALSSTENYYVNYALVATEGKGAGTSCFIVGYTTVTIPAVLLESNPGYTIFDKTTKFVIAPTLYQLDRGADSTTAAAHSADQVVSVYRDLPFVVTDKLAYYTSETDKSLYDITKSLVRKAGVFDLEGALSYPSSITPSTNTTKIKKKNFIITMTVPSLGSLCIDICSRFLTTPANGTVLRIEENALSFLTGDVLREVVPFTDDITGPVTVSFYLRSVSIWSKNKLLHTFSVPMEAELIGDDGSYFQITGTYDQPVSVSMQEACLRIDNYVFDNGRNGAQLLSELIGEKRYFFQDNAAGNIRIYRTRTEVNPSAPYSLAVASGTSEVDAMVTRLKLEGAEVHERYDAEMITRYGNIFHQANMREINTLTDAENYTEILLEDYGSNTSTENFTGAADPRIEPNDILYLTLPSGEKQVIVETIAYKMIGSEKRISFDMMVSGRVPRSSL